MRKAELESCYQHKNSFGTSAQSISMNAVMIGILGVSVILQGCESGQLQNEALGESGVSVSVEPVVRTTLHGYVDVFGSVQPEPPSASGPGGATELGTSVVGVILSIPVSEGQQITKGDLIARLDDRIALAEIERASAKAEFAEKTYERVEILWEQKNASLRRLQESSQALLVARAELLASQSALALVQLRSPIDGTVTQVNVRPGQAVDQNSVIAEVVDLSKLLVSVWVTASDVMFLEVGQPSIVQTDAAGSDVVNGKVIYIGSTVDQNSGAIEVRLSIPGSTALQVGLFVRARIIICTHQDVLAVPLESVFTGVDGESIVSVVSSGITFQRTVTLGLKEQNLVEVDGVGIIEGMNVVTLGSYALPNETTVKILQDPANRN